MREGVSPLWQSAMGTLFTWGLTAAGSALVFIFSGAQRKFLDGSLGFAAGPAIDTASLSGLYGKDGQYAFIPVSFGFAAGAAFVYAADFCLAKMLKRSLTDRQWVTFRAWGRLQHDAFASDLAVSWLCGDLTELVNMSRYQQKLLECTSEIYAFGVGDNPELTAE